MGAISQPVIVNGAPIVGATANSVLYADASKTLQGLTGTQNQLVTFNAGGVPIAGTFASLFGINFETVAGVGYWEFGDTATNLAPYITRNNSSGVGQFHLPNLTGVGNEFSGYFENAANWSQLVWSMAGVESYLRLTASALTMNVGGSLPFALNNLLDISAATAGQIKFPATQNPSSNANTLDDYEEGTWTPILNAWTNVGTPAVSGTYTKIGNRFAVDASIAPGTTISPTAGTSTVTGLPFTPQRNTAASWTRSNTGVNDSNALVDTGGNVYTISVTPTGSTLFFSFVGKST